jgi:hypothetical protein
VVQNEKLSALERELSVRHSLFVAELHLIGTVEDLDDGSDLPAHQAMLRYVCQQRDDIE